MGHLKPNKHCKTCDVRGDYTCLECESTQIKNKGLYVLECEYCMEYPLKSYVEDELGGVFCNEHCFKQMPYENKWKIIRRSA
jgi:hypothetical protein